MRQVIYFLSLIKLLNASMSRNISKKNAFFRFFNEIVVKCYEVKCLKILFPEVIVK